MDRNENLINTKVFRLVGAGMYLIIGTFIYFVSSLFFDVNFYKMSFIFVFIGIYFLSLSLYVDETAKPYKKSFIYKSKHNKTKSAFIVFLYSFFIVFISISFLSILGQITGMNYFLKISKPVNNFYISYIHKNDALLKQDTMSQIENKVRLISNKENVLLHDAARIFVYRNSNHNINEWHNKDDWNLNMVLNIMASGTQKPSLSCGPRAGVLRKIYKYLEIKNRVVHIYTDNYPELRSHTMNEVMINNKWHIQDSDFNIVFINKENNERIDVKTMVSIENYKSIMPYNNEILDWEYNNALVLKGYFEVAKYSKIYYKKIINKNKFLSEIMISQIFN